MGVELTRQEALDAGRHLQATGEDEQALQVYREILRAWPDEARALNNAAVLLKRRKRFGEAAAMLKMAVCLEPSAAGLFANLGNVLRDVGNFPAAETCHRAALRIDPANSDVHVGLAFILLAQGFWSEGFAEYEWRDQRRRLNKSAAVTGKPVWDGAPLGGRTILVHSEQGIGDTLNFVRFARPLAEQGAHVIVRCQPDLISLIRTVPGVAEAVCDEGVDFDVQELLMSLPWRFGTTPETVPGDIPYIRPDPMMAADWRQRLDASAPAGALRVGIIWAGNPSFRGDERRSPRLAAVMPLFSVPDVHFFGMQMGDGRRDLDGVVMPPNFTDLGAEISGFPDTAAIMAGLDVVVTSCTGPAHLAGALGRPTWLLLPYAADWRWLIDRSDSPWYPNARLFRQSRVDDWSAPVASIAEALRREVLKGVHGTNGSQRGDTA